jgi:peptidoglycan/xylan/chitin deacetylase (PgdA/CDA1 family)
LIWKKKTKKKEVWLTFDDGPTPEVTPWILRVLKNQEVKATFFLVGKEIKQYPELLKKIQQQGHAIGNHSYSHFNGWKSKNKKYLSDIKKCDQLIPGNTLFRPPYGKLTFNQIKNLKKKYKIILWDILSLDYEKKITPKKIKENVLENINPGSIIVFHNNHKAYKKIYNNLEDIIIKIKSKGYSFSIIW